MQDKSQDEQDEPDGTPPDEAFFSHLHPNRRTVPAKQHQGHVGSEPFFLPDGGFSTQGVRASPAAPS